MAEAEAEAAAAAEAEAAEAELDRQAQELAEKALEKLHEAVRALKLPKVKEGILKRLREQAKAAPPASAPAAAGSTPAPSAPAAPPPPPPPPPEPEEPAEVEKEPELEELRSVEALGDVQWFADIPLRRSLQQAVAEKHAEQKILVASPAEEIRRICPGGGRVLGAGGVLRLGGAHLGGYGESDVAYAYRQLSRALHPDKNRDVPEAPDAFKRLSDAAEELRQGLQEARAALQALCAAMGGTPAPETLERPQEALLAEASRLLAAILAYSGEGEVCEPASERAGAVFFSSPAFARIQATALLKDWYESPRLIRMYASPALRTAYDCAKKRFRAQFLCLLNRMMVAEAQRQNECIRGEWQQVMEQFVELGLLRDLLERLKSRVFTVEEKQEGEEVKAGKEEKPTPFRPRPKFKPKALLQMLQKGQKGKDRKDDKDSKPSERKDGERTDPVCWNFVTRGFCRQADRCRYLHKFPPGYEVEKAAEAIARQRPDRPPLQDPRRKLAKEIEAALEARNADPKTSEWARWWREAIRSVIPPGGDGAVPINDPEAKRLSMALWRDIAAWAETSGAGRHISLFRAESLGGAGETEVEWAFVPASEILLTVGEGFVGVTGEGLMAEGPLGYLRETYAEVCERLNAVEKSEEEEEVEDDSDKDREKEKASKRSSKEKDKEKKSRRGSKDKSSSRSLSRSRKKDRHRDRRERGRDYWDRGMEEFLRSGVLKDRRRSRSKRRRRSSSR